jgi:fatty-acyl-CoA synthase
VPGSLGRLSYGEVHERARGMAAHLETMGVAPGDRVAIVSPNAARFFISFFGVSGFGRVLVPVNFRLNAEEVDYIVHHSGARVLLVDPEQDAALKGVEVEHRIVLDGLQDVDLVAPVDGRVPAMPEISEDDTATINYTSGTTARPKGVQLTHRNLWSPRSTANRSSIASSVRG